MARLIRWAIVDSGTRKVRAVRTWPLPPAASYARPAPSVVGQSEKLACELIIKAGLVPDVRYAVNPISCRVVGQSPGPNAKVPAGSTVVITAARPNGVAEPAGW